MLIRIIFFINTLLISLACFAGQCLMSEALKDAKLAKNDKFWEEYGALAAKGDVPDAEMKALIEKYGGLSSASKVTATAPVEKSFKLTVQSKAEKEIKTLAPALKNKVDEFLDTALKPGGMQEIRNNPGRWHLEKLNGTDAYTVRLNDGYRVLFQVEGDSLKVLRVNAAQIHSL